MKSCLGLLAALLVFVSVVGGGALIWYLRRHCGILTDRIIVSAC